jgi:predicted Zn finger-like uncharacterized protein
MRMTTRCPRCGTAFRVVPEQLAVRDGHVRCGQCTTVFDARAALVAEPAPEAAPPPEVQGPPSVAPEPLTEPAPEPPPEPPLARAVEIARVEAAVSRPFGASLPPEPEVSLAEADAALEFGPRVRRAARLRAALWGVASLAAAGALAAQAAYAFRGELAVLAPATRPWLEAACAQLRCTIPLPRHVDLISIESSELHVDHNVPDVLTLSAVLRNRAVFGQALPALELTLTDAQDRPVARRVLRPRDYLGAVADTEPVFPANAEHAFKLHIDAAGLNASGYRLFVVYL